MTRSMKKVVGFVLMVCMIVSLFAGVTSAFAAKAFKDVPDGHWAKPYVDFVVDKGYFAGVSEDSEKSKDLLSIIPLLPAIATFLPESTIPVL